MGAPIIVIVYGHLWCLRCGINPRNMLNMPLSLSEKADRK